jgi:ribosomal protein L32
MQTLPAFDMPMVYGGIDTGPVPMLLWCPQCGERHIDEGEFKTKAHHTHACQSCGMVWRPAIVSTVGVQYLPGFKNVE